VTTPERTPPSDPERSVDLLRQAQAGDAQAREDLLARYLPRLERWASRRLPRGVRSMLDTGDIVQEAIIAALRHLDAIEIRSDNAFETYVKRAIRNRIIDVYRRPRRIRQELDDAMPSPQPSALDEAIGQETQARYDAALDGMSDGDCQLIVMHTELGMRIGQIAEELGKSPDAARMGLKRALRRLAEEMQRLQQA
jgi:RNA polymerase sigma factor (sigma-70 family)